MRTFWLMELQLCRRYASDDVSSWSMPRAASLPRPCHQADAARGSTNPSAAPRLIASQLAAAAAAAQEMTAPHQAYGRRRLPLQGC